MPWEAIQTGVSQCAAWIIAAGGYALFDRMSAMGFLSSKNAGEN
jgi:hypothetical protein